MKNRTDISETTLDRQIRTELQKTLPAPSDGEWFNRRLMNRLPDRRRRLIPTILQTACYILAGIILLGSWVYCVVDVAHNGLSPITLLTAALIPAMAFACLAVIAFQAVRHTA